MATDKTKVEKEYTVEDRLKALYELQTMLSEIDRIKTLRGELPLEVQDLEDEIAGLETRVQNFHTEIGELQSAIAAKKVEIQNAQTLIDKYTAQQNNVRNNREFDFLTKEIEFQTLEIELCEKRIKEFSAQENAKKEENGIWDPNIFGKSIEQIVEDGIQAKISQMTEDCQSRLQDALQKIINDSNGGMICIII